MFFANNSTKTNISFDIKGLIPLFLFFWYFSAITHLLMELSGSTVFVGFRQAFIMSFLWLVPILLFPKKARIMSAIIGIVLWAFSLVSLGYFAVYHQEFSQSVIFIIFESNLAESSEYLSHYFSWWMFFGLVVHSAVAYLLWCRIHPLEIKFKNAVLLSIFIVVGLIIYPVFKRVVIQKMPMSGAIEKLQISMEPALPWQIIFGYTQYKQQLSNMNMMLEANSKIPPLANLKDGLAGQPATLVLVIGESTSRLHMSLYGYKRSTTPHLDAMRSQLTVFKRAFSSRPSTIESLEQVLSFADQQHPNLYLTKPSLINMMKQAGYKSYWITNQQTVTKRNTMLTIFSKQTDKQYYLNNTRAQNSRQYDGDVLEPYQEILHDAESRKFIVVHLLGAHMKYEYRYPPEYNYFKDNIGVYAELRSAQIKVYNAYDNAVLYNDYVVSHLIDELARSKVNAALVYLSDHAEDVFDSDDHQFNGRDEGNPTQEMYTIPFLIWHSPAFRENEHLSYNMMVDKIYCISDFIYTWAELAGLYFDDFDATKSLLNAAYKERSVLVGDPYGKKKLINLSSLK